MLDFTPMSDEKPRKTALLGEGFYLRPRDAARAVGRSQRTLLNWEASGNFPLRARTPDGKPIGYIREDIENWMRKTRREK